ncbi:hypothetical protein ACLBR5_16720 [Escherichia coli]
MPLPLTRVKTARSTSTDKKPFCAVEELRMLVLARDPQPKDPKKAFTLWWGLKLPISPA